MWYTMCIVHCSATDNIYTIWGSKGDLNTVWYPVHYRKSPSENNLLHFIMPNKNNFSSDLKQRIDNHVILGHSHGEATKLQQRKVPCKVHEGSS